MSEIHSYRDLAVWQRSVDIAIEIYGMTGTFPRSEEYGLASQMRRATVSIPSNIAEGRARPGKEFGRFLGIALGSLAELETQLEIARRLSCLSEENYPHVTGELDIIGKQIRRLLQRVRN